jgi:hypothetical protein
MTFRERGEHTARIGLIRSGWSVPAMTVGYRY